MTDKEESIVLGVGLRPADASKYSAECRIFRFKTEQALGRTRRNIIGGTTRQGASRGQRGSSEGERERAQVRGRTGWPMTSVEVRLSVSSQEYFTQ